MRRKSFVDLTALLDVMLILFFAAIINMASSADLAKEASEEIASDLKIEQSRVETLEKELTQTQDLLDTTLESLAISENELASLYGSEVEDLADYKEILSKISKIEVMLVGQLNEVWINDQDVNIHIIRERLETFDREAILKKDLMNAINLAIDQRNKSDIIFIKVSVQDREVYKYAYDYLIKVLDEVVEAYGKDKVMISKDF